MTTYTHDNGIIVGYTGGQIAIWNALADGLGDRQYIHPPQAEAIHAAYLRFRRDLGICEAGGGHWCGSWYGYCDAECGCPCMEVES